LRERRLAESVVGFVRRAASVRECERAQAVDLATRDLSKALREAGLVVLCTPIGQMKELIERMLPNLESGTIVTDVGSVKSGVVCALEAKVGSAGAHFIGSHPMAGAEKTGVSAARADLFVNAVCVVTPTVASDKRALRKVEQLWKSVGSRVVRLNPSVHDDLVSRSSHLPHVVAAGLANFVLNPQQPGNQGILCANGFRDTTRVASGSPEMWRDIALANRENLLQALEGFVGGLQSFRRVLKSGDAEAISRFFEQAKVRRDRWARRAASSSPE
jgi:prephenate dehydrogenase